MQANMRAVEVYKGSDGDVTKAYYLQLLAKGPIGVIAMNLFRAQKCSSRAKVYRGGVRGKGSFKSMAYERKGWSMEQLCIALERGDTYGIKFGWKADPGVTLQGGDAWVLYVDLQSGQVSFHSQTRYTGPIYPGDWDGLHKSAERILVFCDAVMDGCVSEVLA